MIYNFDLNGQAKSDSAESHTAKFLLQVIPIYIFKSINQIGIEYLH